MGWTRTRKKKNFDTDVNNNDDRDDYGDGDNLMKPIKQRKFMQEEEFCRKGTTAIQVSHPPPPTPPHPLPPLANDSTITNQDKWKIVSEQQTNVQDTFIQIHHLRE